MKGFPGVQALDDARFELKRGEVHALVGENGAGKSTLIKIVTGLYTRDSGDIEFEGEKINFRSTMECRKNGIALIPQELQLVDPLTVAENIFMTDYPKKRGVIDWKKMKAMTHGLQQQLGDAALSFRPDQLVKTLSMGQKQLVEIMKAISTEVKIIAFDEPTSSLSDEETSEMFRLIRVLTKQGISIIYVSHRLAEIFEICDRVTVFKDGRYIDTRATKEVEAKELIAMMVGRDMNLYEKTIRENDNETVFEVNGLKSAPKVKDVSFSLKKGEILGMFGIVGSGRTETVRAIFGLEDTQAGEIKVNGKPISIRRPKDAVDAGIGLVTEDRRGEGVSLVMNVTENITMPYFKRFVSRGAINFHKERQAAAQMVDAFKIKTPKLETKVESLSGGNQQKIVIAKWLGADSEILIFDEPTRGIDVGAKAEIHRLMDQMTREGKSIIMISSDLPEILAMSDRVLVFRDGVIRAELTEPKTLTEKDVLQYAIKASWNN